jgi:hypothetical protein
MENLREMPYLTVPQLHAAIYALCELYYKNPELNSYCLEVAEILAFTDSLKEYLCYCQELIGQRNMLKNPPS